MIRHVLALGAVVSGVLAPACEGVSSTEVNHTDQDGRTFDVRFESQGVMLSGTLWLPTGPGPHPAMVVVHGSGRATRRDALGPANRFNQLGIAVLGYDKRGVGESGGEYVGRENASETNLTLLAHDAAAGIAALRERDDIDPSHIGLWGVSQAGWIVPMAATFAEDVAFTILVSGPTVTVGEENYYSDLTGDDRGTRERLSQTELSRLLAERGPFGFDPRPWLARMTMPGAWLLGGLDESIPIPETVAILDELIEDQRPNFVYRVWPDATHSLRVRGRTVPEFWEYQEEFLTNRVGLPVSQAPNP